jgi:hypothetical protein
MHQAKVDMRPALTPSVRDNPLARARRIIE